MINSFEDLPDKIRQKIQISSGGCWVWTGCYSIVKWGGRYGYLRIGGRTQNAHRYVYGFFKGNPEFTLDHLCRNTLCVNPDHLEDVTMNANIMRGKGFGAINARKTSCIRGHEFTPDNTLRRSDNPNWRACRICRNAFNRAWMRNNYKKPPNNMRERENLP